MGIELRRVESPDEREEVCRNILQALPDWFGIPEAIEEYAKDCRALPVMAAYDAGLPIGFLAARESSKAAMELHVMGILTTHHRMGIGRRLIDQAEGAARARGKRYLCVLTLDSAHPDPYYARTREFYRAMGFLPLITHETLWGAENPCLVMVKTL